MGHFIINGNKRLSGEVEISGSKNAALPMIFSTIMMHGVSRISNLPDISDVDVALEILSELGAVINRHGGSVEIDTQNLVYRTPSEELTSKIRASSYLLGAMLSRFGEAHIQCFGGCNFDARPIDMHLYAATTLGAAVTDKVVMADRLYGGEIRFSKISVGATINAILMTSGAIGESRIYGYAKEPHVISLIDFLNSAGARITLSDEYISVRGAFLHGGTGTVISDMIEAGTYIILSVMTNSELKIKGADISHLDSFVDVLVRAGVVIEHYGDTIVASGIPDEPFEVVTEAYPGFPTDLQPQMAPLIAMYCGGTITENVWHNRFGYLRELKKFGVEYELFDGYAVIKKSNISSSTAQAPDLRGGVAIMLCALVAEGKNILLKKDLILRGYSDIIKKLTKIGAEVSENSED